jgi:hypothetical protein
MIHNNDSTQAVAIPVNVDVESEERQYLREREVIEPSYLSINYEQIPDNPNQT